MEYREIGSIKEGFNIKKKTENIIIMDISTKKLIFYSAEEKYFKSLKYNFTEDVLQLDFYREKRYSFNYNKNTKQYLLISIEHDDLPSCNL